MNKKIIIKQLKKAFIFLLTSSFLLINNQVLQASSEKDLILVLDTSLTMAGYGKGSTNILPQVKESLPQFIEQLEKNDSVTLITFDTDVKIYPTIYISSKKSKESLIDYIKNIKATGAWTYTSMMMKTVFQKAQELEAKDKDRQRIIVVMTDTLDDPPPGKLADRLNIKEIGKRYKDKDWFIFYVNFGDAIKNNPKLAKMQKELQANISKFTNVIDAKTNEKLIKKTIEKELPENISKMTDKKTEIAKEGAFPVIPLLIALLVIAIVLAIIYYIKTVSGLKVSGKLEYWDHSLLSPYFENYDLTKQNVKEILVGPKNTYNLTIRDLEISDPFKITAIKANGEVNNNLQAGKGYLIEYVNRESGGYLKNGDIFRVANYTFKYTSK